MKKIFSLLLIICLLVVAVGCKKDKQAAVNNIPETEATEPTAETQGEPVTLSAAYAAVSLPIETKEITADDGTVIFTRSHQAMRLTLSGQVTADLIITDFMSRVDNITATADTIEETAKAAYPYAHNWIPYSTKLRYTPTRIDASVLSLYGTNITFTGGSHPDYTCLSANYSLISGDPLTLGSILTHEDKTEALQKLLIAKLDEQAEEKFLQQEYQTVINDRFSGDESFDEKWYFSENGLCFYFAPYEIAPYSSGVIVAEIPYSELVGIIADEYFPPEVNIANGNATVVPFSVETAQNYAQISEFVMDPEGDRFFIEADSCIQNISIAILVEDPGGVSTETLYKAFYLNPGDAIMVQTKNADDLVINYKQGDDMISLPII